MGSCRTIFFLGLGLLGLGCSRDREGRELGFGSASLGDVLPSLKESGGDGELSAEALGCDDLPSLSAEELARPPFSPLALEKSVTRPDLPPPRYRVLADVVLVDAVAERVSTIDDAYFRRTGKHLTVTSGSRDAARQGKAMYKMLRLGGDPERLYRNKAAAREIKQAYENGRAAGKAEDDIVISMVKVLEGQIARGVYISAHLRAGAVDIRSRDMSSAEKKAFVAATTEVSGIYVLEESTPPHFHLQID